MGEDQNTIITHRILFPVSLRPWWRHQMETFSALQPFVRGIHRSPVNSPHKCRWHRALMFSLICTLNKRLSKQSWGWWFETPSRSFFNGVIVMYLRSGDDVLIAYTSTYKVIFNSLGMVKYAWWRHQMEKNPITGHLCGEFTGHRWIPHKKATDGKLWCSTMRLFLCNIWGWMLLVKSCLLCLLW